MIPDLPPQHSADYATQVTRDTALVLADHPSSRSVRDRVVAHLDASFGISHPCALEGLIPTAIATYRALSGLPQDDTTVEPRVRRLVRHSLTLDARPFTGASDVSWGLGNHLTGPPTCKQRHGHHQTLATIPDDPTLP